MRIWRDDGVCPWREEMGEVKVWVMGMVTGAEMGK